MNELKCTELNKLKYHQQVLENAIDSISLRLKNCPDLIEVFETFQDSRTKSEAQREELLNWLRRVRASVDTKRHLLRDGEALHSFTDFKTFKKEMITLQDQIQTLKIHILNELLHINEEIVYVNEDVEMYSDKMIEWSENHKTNMLPSIDVPHTIKKIANRHQCKEMRTFMDFVYKSKGHENGWRQADHLLFMKMRKKHKDVDDLCSKLNELLPDIPVDEIKKHEEWYKQYLHLNKLKKAAVKTWQQSKKGRQQTKPNEQPGNHEDFPKIIPSMEDLRDRLKEWKDEKEARLMQNKQTQMLKEMQQKDREEQRKKRNEELKKIVTEWKQTKEEIKERQQTEKREMEEKEKRKRTSEANRSIKRFQTQDDAFVTKIVQQRKKRETKLPVRSKSSQSAFRDPERLLRPTKQWINRLHDDKCYVIGVNPEKLPKLKVPEWRQQIN